MSNALANPLLDDDSGLGNQFAGETYQDVLDWYEATGFGDRDTTPAQYPNVVGSSYVTGEDGRYYNDAGEKLYWFDPPSELGRGGQSSLGDADNSGFYTQSDIKRYWDADQGMGYFKQANPDLTFDSYMEFLNQKQLLIESGEMAKLDGDELYRQGHKGRGPNADAINAIVVAHRDQVNQKNRELTSALAQSYGIQQSYRNGDGDLFTFNGSNYHKAVKQDDHDWSQVIGNIVIDVAFKAITMQAGAALLDQAVASSGFDNLTDMIRSIPGTNLEMAEAMAGMLGSPVAGGGAIGVSSAENWRKMAEEIINNPEWSNVIVNYSSSGEATGVDGTGPEFSDGTVLFDTRNLPSIYSIVNGDIVHTESGTVMIEGNYSSDKNWLVTFKPYKAEGNDGGGGAPASSSNTASTSSASSSSASTTSTTSPSSNGGANNSGQYVVVGKTEDGKWIIKDTVDGDKWILADGEYKLGDVIPQAVMVNATSAPASITTSSTNTTSSSSTNSTTASTSSTAGTTSNTNGSTSTTTTPTTPPPPKPGDACTLSDGSAGTIDGGGACQPSTGRFVNGAWMAGIDTAYQTGVKPSNSCESGWEYGNGTCIPADSPHVPKSNPSNATATSSTPASSTTSSTSTTASTNTTSTSTTPSTSTSTTASANTSNTTGTSQGPGNGPDEGPGDSEGDPGNGGNGGMLGGAIPGLRSGSKDSWSPLFPGYQFRKFNKNRGNRMGASMTNTPNFQAREDLVNSLWKEVMKR